jgi:hypothetical protein
MKSKDSELLALLSVNFKLCLTQMSDHLVGICCCPYFATESDVSQFSEFSMSSVLWHYEVSTIQTYRNMKIKHMKCCNSDTVITGQVSTFSAPNYLNIPLKFAHRTLSHPVYFIMNKCFLYCQLIIKLFIKFRLSFL